MSTGERKPVAPFYAVAALWPLCGALLPLYKPSHYILLAAVSVVVFLLADKLCRSGGTVGEPETVQPPPAPQPAPQAASGGESELEKTLRIGGQAVAEMRQLNAKISAPGISADISRLEQITGKIFQAVRDDPSKLPQLGRFTDYYLPTTLKLLRSYERMSGAGVSGENISSSIVRIETMIRNVVLAFGKQLDSLYGSEALDISADIKVLETMMAREGLTGQELKADGPDIRLEL